MLSAGTKQDLSTKYYLSIIRLLLLLTVYQYGIASASTSYQYFEILIPEEISYIYKIRAAENFGTSFRHIYHRINLVVAEPYLGCSPLLNKHVVDGAVVLLKQGKCTFVTKSFHAEQAGAVAVLITDSDSNNDSEYFNMIHDSSSHIIDIPVFFMLGKDGWMISETLRRWYHFGIINIPVNISRVPVDQLHFPPWTIW
ncbi:protease-associated domain-containing protein 1 [Octopus bimaculoides]|uniref:PA domain-containing protein n=1 Tax=Octopus bimaculoides TaxID=37653 RepID=A0A0L8HZ61_OCTBM|nr:protease-associated domain-containing protein 1 [Octopus bimaculoides]|eukprot:XP_014768145.1 PREDICTED: protease-associated domain-containing protein 1-like [Octopus bimaculoides]